MKLHHVSNWHRYLGLAISLFVVLLTITGILLLHTDDLRLQQRFMDNSLILDWYGISPEGEPRAYRVAQSWITQLDEQVYLDGEVLTASSEELQGAIVLDEYIVVALDSSLYLLTFEGILIERMSQAQGIPTGIRGIAATGGDGVVLQTSVGNFASDANLVTWSPLSGARQEWSNMEAVPAEQLEVIMARYRGQGLPLERVILDLHSGRILGHYGPWVTDIVAILFLLLSLTGWWSWIKRRALQREIEQE